jgi:hypothetical protein
MQTFNLINAQDRVKKSRATINANFEAVASNFSGIAFPTVNLYVGMKCYRTDLNQTFTLNNVELQTWVDDSDIADKAITTEKLADQSVTKEKISHGAVTTEKIGDSAVTVDKIASRSITQDKIAIGVLTAHNVGAYTKNEVYNKGELFNRTESDNRYYQKAQTYSRAEIYNRGEVDSRVNAKVNKSGDTMTANLRFDGTNVGLTSNSGYMQFNGTDTGDAIAGGNGANVNIGSWYGLGFYSIQTKKYTGSMDLRNGDWRTVGNMTAHEGFIVKGNSGFVFGDHNGGWYMSDNDWVRSRANKSIYTAGRMKADGGFEGNLNGRANSANFVFNDVSEMRFHWQTEPGQPLNIWGSKRDDSTHVYCFNPSNFHVNRANTADRAVVSDRAVRVENDYSIMRFHWSGQGGQPSWLWGGNDGENMYVYNPSNFTVSRANTAGAADNSKNFDGRSLSNILGLIDAANTGAVEAKLEENGYIKLRNGLTIQWGTIKQNIKEYTFLITHKKFVQVFLTTGIETMNINDFSTTYGATLVGKPTLTKFTAIIGDTEKEHIVDNTNMFLGSWFSIGI